VGPDALIGEIALISTSKRPVSAVAREPTTVLKISRALFHRVLQEFPGSAARARMVISERLTAFAKELEKTRSFRPDP
jgi:CRP-like cAMP-binding protein